MKYDRDPLLAPASLKSLPGNALEAAPVIQDGDLTLAESAAIVEYIIYKYGSGRLIVPPSAPNWTDYLYWFHLANGGLQPAKQFGTFVKIGQLPEDNRLLGFAAMRRDRMLKHYNERLGKVPYLAGDELTAADIMTVYSLTTNRYFEASSLKGYDNILAYLKGIGERPAYKTAMKKGDPDMIPALAEELPTKPLL